MLPNSHQPLWPTHPPRIPSTNCYKLFIAGLWHYSAKEAICFLTVSKGGGTFCLLWYYNFEDAIIFIKFSWFWHQGLRSRGEPQEDLQDCINAMKRFSIRVKEIWMLHPPSIRDSSIPYSLSALPFLPSCPLPALPSSWSPNSPLILLGISPKPPSLLPSPSDRPRSTESPRKCFNYIYINIELRQEGGGGGI